MKIKFLEQPLNKIKRKSTPSNARSHKLTDRYQAPVKKMRPGLALLVASGAILYFVGMLDYAPNQNPILTTNVKNNNLVGNFGIFSTYYSIYFLGITVWLIPLLLIYLAYLMIAGRAPEANWKRSLALLLMLITSSILLDRFYPERSPLYVSGGGGLLGGFLYNRVLYQPIGDFGAVFLSATLLVIASIFFFITDLGQFWRRCSVRSRWLAGYLWQEGYGLYKNLKKIPWVNKNYEYGRTEPLTNRATSVETVENQRVLTLAKQARKAIAKVEPSQDALVENETTKPFESTTGKQKTQGIVVIEEKPLEKAHFECPQASGDFIFPSLEILTAPVVVTDFQREEDFQLVAEKLKRTLADFKLEVQLGEVHRGPVITRYEVTPAPGVRVEKIANLDKNIAMSLHASGIRILAPVPGKGCVGIEVPNAQPLPVSIRDILESKDWALKKCEIPLALGKEVSGRPLIVDLTRMPHLLIAGSTGSGKTVCINSIITSLLYHSSPDDLRFIMVDPKIVEMQVYNQLPHMLIPVVTEPKKVPAALKWLLAEMERRYQIFAKKGVRNIAGFNAKQAKQKEAEEREKVMQANMTPEERDALNNLEIAENGTVEVPSKLPYIVCIIDELADLMMVAPADIETGIARLAQLARAAGIHLIIATQRPSVNVITGVIKANLPSRISFKVASKVDSRTILDAGGADTLIGRGDMLMVPPGTSDLVRGQGAFVSDEEITAIVSFLSEKNGEPRFAESVQAEIDTAGEEDDQAIPLKGDYQDEMIPKAIEIIKTTKRASTSMLQRKLKIGYNRAARIMDILEEEGLVGPENGSNPRDLTNELQE